MPEYLSEKQSKETDIATKKAQAEIMRRYQEDATKKWDESRARQEEQYRRQQQTVGAHINALACRKR